ncbi:MAG TPA: SelB C-terminal domain-containing protein, partial [Fimbriimonas sp.]|nr:SelB C-terminal domain-containing protein [Fimbriimonas sp.]
MAKLTWDKFDSHVAKLELKDELYVAVGQQVLVTKPGPNAWLAGGAVSSINIEQHKLGDSLRFAEITNLEEGILAAVHEDPDGVTTEEICRLIGRSPQQLGNAFENLIASKQLLGFAGLWYKPAVFIVQANKFLAALDELHEAQPSVLSHDRETIVKSAKLNWFGKHLDRMMTNLEELGKISFDGKRIKRADFKLRLRQHQIAFLERVIEELDQTLINNPYPSEIASKLGTPVQSVEEIMQLGVLSGHLVQLSSSLLYSHNQLQRLREKTIELFGYEDFTAIEFKDALSSSRKFAIPILDYFDATGFTERKTEKRRVRKV